ncbi:MAG: hypothetical protein ABEI27_08700 [Halobellus sp.]|uniref:hypothetical protein n=1 Tax=Halobellus sp. TaxID=1979212 RepID=UPI0035D4B779
MKLGIVLVKAHCHAQRYAARIQGHGDDSVHETLPDKMKKAVPAEESDGDEDVIVYDNSDRVLRDMDT